jgi:antitoxin component YwqK of YwqJK toxin-antitoxin module
MWKNGEADGMERQWYSDGRKDFERMWKDGKRDGLEQWWLRNGHVMKYLWENGKPTKLKNDKNT